MIKSRPTPRKKGDTSIFKNRCVPFFKNFKKRLFVNSIYVKIKTLQERNKNIKRQTREPRDARRLGVPLR
jgi:hypothetical protein